MASSATNRAYLETVIANTYAELATLSADATVAGGKPDAAGPNTVAHDAYERKLWFRLREAKQELASVDGVAEVVTEGYV